MKVSPPQPIRATKSNESKALVTIQHKVTKVIIYYCISNESKLFIIYYCMLLIVVE